MGVPVYMGVEAIEQNTLPLGIPFDYIASSPRALILHQISSDLLRPSSNSTGHNLMAAQSDILKTSASLPPGLDAINRASGGVGASTVARSALEPPLQLE